VISSQTSPPTVDRMFVPRPIDQSSMYLLVERLGRLLRRARTCLLCDPPSDARICDRADCGNAIPAARIAEPVRALIAKIAGLGCAGRACRSILLIRRLRADLRNRRSPGERAQNHAEKMHRRKFPLNWVSSLGPRFCILSVPTHR